MLYSSMAGVGTGVWFNLGLAGPAGVWFILVGPVWRWCAGVAGAHFTLTAGKRYKRQKTALNWKACYSATCIVKILSEVTCTQ